MRQTRLLYIINGFASAGAEMGLVTLVKQGFFEGFDLRIVALVSAEGPVYANLVKLLGADKIFFKRKAKRVPDILLPLFIMDIIQEYYRFKPDVAILSLPQSVVCGRVASLFYPRVRLATFEHNVERERRVANILLRLTSKWTDLILGDARFTLEKCREIYSRPLPMVEVPLAILEPSLPRVWQKPEIVHVITLGRLVTQKNYAELLRGIALLLDENYNLELSFAGAGELRDELEALAAGLGIKDRVHFLGFVENTAELLAQSHIYVQPSLREGLAISVLQAMASGLIVVASDVGGICDYGADKINMFKISPPPAAQAIAAALKTAVDTYAELEPMSRAAQRTVQEQFSESAVRQKWEIARAALQNIRTD